MKKKIPLKTIRPYVSDKTYRKFVIGYYLEKIGYLWMWPLKGIYYLFCGFICALCAITEKLEEIGDYLWGKWCGLVQKNLTETERAIIWNAFSEVRNNEK